MVIDDICPCAKEEFENKFNTEFTSVLRGKTTDTVALKKTLDNHRTEIVGKLFGMYYLSSDGVYYASERTKKYIADNDQPAFFKDVCFKMQFPNGMNKIQTLQPYLDNKISLRQYPFIVKCLQLAEVERVYLSVTDIGYYILNSLDVLKGLASPYEVICQIKEDRKNGIERKIIVPGKASSYTMQHIREQLNYLELANLIYISEEKHIILNHKEDVCLKVFADECGKPPLFDVYSYDLRTTENRELFYSEWNLFYSKISESADSFETSVSALISHEDSTKPQTTPGKNTVELGDEGEEFILEYEKKRVAAFNPRLVNKVLPLGKTKGLGYDIQSVFAEPGDWAEFVKYIEVKSTKRVTAPDISDESWTDTINITRNEWVAAQQHKNFYSIYRVYFVRDGIVAFVINDIYQKEIDGKLQIVPTMYRVDFSNGAIDSVLR